MNNRLEIALRELVDALRAELATDPNAGPEHLLSIDEAAATLGIGRSTLYQELDAGRIRSLKVGRRRLVPSSAIAERIGKSP
jgi:excisionase family DNA binding protein